VGRREPKVLARELGLLMPDNHCCCGCVACQGGGLLNLQVDIAGITAIDPFPGGFIICPQCGEVNNSYLLPQTAINFLNGSGDMTCQYGPLTANFPGCNWNGGIATIVATITAWLTAKTQPGGGTATYLDVLLGLIRSDPAGGGRGYCANIHFTKQYTSIIDCTTINDDLTPAITVVNCGGAPVIAPCKVTSATCHARTV
jgi:hypothetical protein